MKRSHLVASTVIGMALLFWTNAAFAYLYGFECITDKNASNAMIGESQLFVEVLPYIDNQVVFWFKNIGPEPSSIEGIYFDDGSLLQLAELIDEDDSGGMPGVDFSQGASPPDLSGGNTLDPAFDVTAGFLADSDPPTSHNGVNPGEILGIVYTLHTGLALDDVINDLASGALRIGVHVIAFDYGGSESFVNSAVVPIPGAALLFVPGLGMLAWIRRRTR